ncbi:hypothetical protein JTB14_036508 [Gonioctena quinquepunctata]|nr:hypothetical protein JTB14_036508 [Gonioctena quinquepunctata]
MLSLSPLDQALPEIDKQFTEMKLSDSRRIKIMESLNRPEAYEAYMKFKPSCSGEKQGRSFITPHKKHVAKKVPPPQETTTSNRFSVLDTTDNTEIPVESLQENHMDTQDLTSTPNTEVKKPPPIIIREKKN